MGGGGFEAEAEDRWGRAAIDLIAGHAGEHATRIGGGCVNGQASEIVRGRQVPPGNLPRLEAALPIVPEDRKRSTASGPDEEFVAAVPIEIGPGDAGAGVAEEFCEKRLALEFVERGVGVAMMDPIADIL